jgi:hypothetical protein
LVEGEVVVRGPGGRHDHIAGGVPLADGRVVVVVDREVRETPGGTRGGPLLDARGPVAGVTEELLREDLRAHAADVLRPILPFPGERARELRVKERQRALDAAEGIGFHDRRVVDGGCARRRRQERHRRLARLRTRSAEAREAAAEIPQHLPVLEGRAHRLLERELPDVLERRVRQGQRLERARSLVERRLARVGVFDLLDRPHVV